MTENPLISVVVITYNSAKTVLETLESIKKQTYRYLELIISDDCSKDDTVGVCKEWVDKNQSRFVRTEIVTVENNTGTSSNCNRGYNAAIGIWIKGIAGDDILMNNCIENCVNYILENPQTEVLISKVKFIGDNKRIEKYKNLFCYGALELKSKELLYLLLLNNFLPASTLFINKKTFNQLGGFEESIPLLEDWPFWIKTLYNKKKISFNNEFTIYYRMSENSISLNTVSSRLYLQSLIKFQNDFLSEYQWKTNKLLWLYYHINRYKFSKRIYIRLLSQLVNCINPLYYYIAYLNSKKNRLNQKYNLL